MVQETEVMRMFRQEELKLVDSRYFNIITVDDYDVTIQSRNTWHYWYLHSTDVPGNTACIIFHKHKYSHPTTSTGVDIASDRRFGAYRAMTGGK